MENVMPAPETQNRDLTLPPDTYLYLQNEAKGGAITVHRGPALVNQTGQDKPVRYDPNKRQYFPCSLEDARQQFPRAAEGDYVILENPSEDEKFPSETNNPSKQLKKGRRIVIPGPWSEALYPGQNATVVEGHRLRSNQYLVAIIYNDEEARKNWDKTVVKAQTDLLPKLDPEGNPIPPDSAHQQTVQAKGLPKPTDFAVGTRIVIKGIDVSFYIPCTGVEVMVEDGKYVRDAVTLEQLEYCCLIDENGKKTYPKGPAVVFPSPTQVFEQDSKKRRKFTPIELNTINGIHLKVTADFKGPDLEKRSSEEREYKEGEELFVTGRTMSIYYPREELAIIEYGSGNKKHYSTAIPKGEGRYVINREQGEIRVEKGPAMYLADPRKEIPVRRVLSQAECKLWYPGNEEALAYNRDLEEAVAEAPSGRSGVISEGDYRRRQVRQRGGGSTPMMAANYLAAGASAGLADYSPEEVSDEDSGGSITRGTKYTQPKQLTLNTKYDGVPKIEVYPGYAVLIVGAAGSRRVVIGPQVVLLEYDEKLGFMDLSTGKPKTTDRLYRTAYLCVKNNQVSDIVGFESADHVKGTVKVSLRVNFEADSEESRLNWFATDNYVKLLTDHIRSIIAGMAKRNSVAEIKGNYVNLVRDAILGAKSDPQSKRPGLSFENGLHVNEVEVLELGLADPNIAKLLDSAQTEVVKANITIDQARRDLETTREMERISQAKAIAQTETNMKANELKRELLDSELTVILTGFEQELKKLEERKKACVANEDISDLSNERKLARDKTVADQLMEVDRTKQALRLELILAETKSAVDRLAAAKDGLHETMVTLSRDDMVNKLAEAVNIERFLSGDGMGNSLSNIFAAFPALKQLMDRGEAIRTNGRNRLTQQTPSAS
jgi:major vault protein